jgi:Tfp pilus assembly protein FimT
MSRGKNDDFSPIELLIGVATIQIIGPVAIPNFAARTAASSRPTATTISYLTLTSMQG